MPIRPPREQGDYPDRLLECEEALETDIIVVLEEAQSVGWSAAEAALAITELVENYLIAQGENAKTEFALLRTRLKQAE